MSGFADGFKAKAKSATIAPDDHATHARLAAKVANRAVLSPAEVGGVTVLVPFFHAQLDYPPSANRYWRTTRTGRVYVSPEAKAYKAKVALRFAGRKPMHGPVRVMLNVFRPKKQGDLDNVRKVLYDALEGFAYFDDKQIVEDHAWLGDDKFNPRVVIKIEVVK